MFGGYRVLVNFPDGTRDVITVMDAPIHDMELPHRGLVWLVSTSTIREDTVDGEEIQFEVSVIPKEPAEPPPPIELR